MTSDHFSKDHPAALITSRQKVLEAIEMGNGRWASRALVQQDAEWADIRVGICDKGCTSDGNDSSE